MQPFVTDRIEAWRDRMTRRLGPIDLSADDPASFRATMGDERLGIVHVTSLTVSPFRVRRTAKMIRQSDPEVFVLMLPLRGHIHIRENRTDTELHLSELALYGTSHPRELQICPSGATARGIMVTFPYAMLPLELQKEKRVRTFSSRYGVGSLLSDFLTSLCTGSSCYRPADTPRLGTILIDLLATQLAHQLDPMRSVPAEAHEDALLVGILAFIQRHLADPELTPASIAAAHNISLRQLHRLFQSQETTVADWIRICRLNRCRRDLTDSLLSRMPIHAVAARWGFSNAAHFTRLFGNRYGISPQGYRSAQLRTSPISAAHST